MHPAVRGVFRRASELASVEPAGRRTQDAFVNTGDQNPSYRAVWFHKSDIQNRLHSHPDVIIEPKQNKENYAKGLWAKSSRLLVANRIRTTTVSTSALLLDNPALGSAWVPITPNEKSPEYLKALCLWLNSSWTVLQLLGMRSKTLTYPSFSLIQLRSLLLPDPNLNMDINALARVYDELCDHPMKMWKEMNVCSVRKEIDEACTDCLGLKKGEGAELRELISREPTVNPRA